MRRHLTIAAVVLFGLGLSMVGNTVTPSVASPGVAEPEVPLPAPSLRRMSEAQYRNVITDVFGGTIKMAGPFDTPLRQEGMLAVGTRKLEFTPTRFEGAMQLAKSVAQQVTNERNRDFLIGCTPKTINRADEACAAKFFKTVAPLLLRKPVPNRDLQNFVDAANEAAADLGDFYKGLEFALVGLLVSPDFLYISEIAVPAKGSKDEARLDNYSQASRLSFFLWNSAPDDELMRAAARGDLSDPEKRGVQVDRMLKSPRLERSVRAFFSDMFEFDHFAQMAKDPIRFPVFNSNVIEDVQEQTLRTVVDHLITRHESYRTLFTTRKTFMSPALGPLYRVSVTPNAAWMPYEFSQEDGRAGIQAQASFLTLHSHPGRSSPTLRGKALREVVLCQKVPPPPGNVDFDQFNQASTHPQTARDKLALHNQNPICAGCHKITDPMGFVLESFDGAGQYRETDNGLPLNLSGELDGKKFASVSEFGSVLSESKALSTCLVRRMYSYATGYAANSPLVSYLDGQFAAKDHRLPELMRTIALSEAFQKISIDKNPLQQSADVTNSSKK